MYRVLTVAREYGSGGRDIAGRVAKHLGWKLLDSALIEEAAKLACVDPQCARGYDERVDSWLHRVSRRALWHGAFEGVAEVAETDVLDGEIMARLSKAAIEHAYELGACVIVGRGGQCVLQDRPDVFHVFIYAPWQEKLARVRHRAGNEPDTEEFMRTMDAERARYVRLNFGRDWREPHLYHLMISSTLGEEAAVWTILTAMYEGR